MSAPRMILTHTHSCRLRLRMQFLPIVDGLYQGILILLKLVAIRLVATVHISERLIFNDLKNRLHIDEPPQSYDSLRFSWDNLCQDGRRMLIHCFVKSLCLRKTGVFNCNSFIWENRRTITFVS
jgi:hypothetical protein